MVLGNRPANPRLRAQNGARSRFVTTIHVDLGALKVRAGQNRAGCRGRTGQEPFRTPNVQIVADQPAMGALVCPCTTVIVPTFSGHCESQSIRADVIDNTGTRREDPAFTQVARRDQVLTAAVAVVLDLE